MSKLVEYGWSDFFSRNMEESNDCVPARVTAEHRSEYRVQTERGERVARISGRLRHESGTKAELPAVGDWVAVQASSPGECTICRLLPRRSKFSRKVAGNVTQEQVVAANVDTVWIVSSLDQDFSIRRIERYLTLAWESGADPVVVLTKADVCQDVVQCRYRVELAAIGVQVHATSSLRDEGLADLERYLRGHATVALLGSSGVGKSTLINALAGSALQRTSDVRGDGKGRHTTIHRQLVRLPRGGLIIDTPGMRELQLWETDSGLSDTFCEIDALAMHCRFSDCRHTVEPGCAVTAAVESGELGSERLMSFQKLQREQAHLERKLDMRAQLEEKQRIKTIMKSVRHHPKYKR